MTTPSGITALQAARGQWNDGNLDGYLRLYHPDVVLHGYAGVGPGFDNVKAFYAAFWSAFPASKLIFEDVFADQHDRVACRFVVKGEHKGQFQGLPPSGGRFELPGITILRFDGDRCLERWSQANFLSLLQQLGALPTA